MKSVDERKVDYFRPINRFKLMVNVLRSFVKTFLMFEEFEGKQDIFRIEVIEIMLVA